MPSFFARLLLLLTLLLATSRSQAQTIDTEAATAYTIYHNGLTKQLLDHADDPFAFALLYQKVAKKDKYHQHPPVFSATSVRYLTQLSRKYAKPSPTKR